MPKLQVSDIFYSIQGEGGNIGKAAVFIRLYDCNLSCAFCDDDKHKTLSNTMHFEEIAEAIAGYSSKFVIITGGEPSLQDINPFIRFLQARSYFVAVETNGYRFDNIKQADFITYSPKDWDTIKKDGFSEMKLIVSRNSDVSKILKLDINVPVYLQPENKKETPDAENVNFCIELVEKHPKFLLSPQLHKFLGVK